LAPEFTQPSLLNTPEVNGRHFSRASSGALAKRRPAQLYQLRGLTVAPDGPLIIAETLNSVLRKVG
jgi:hypothetical protein